MDPAQIAQLLRNLTQSLNISDDMLLREVPLELVSPAVYVALTVLYSVTAALSIAGNLAVIAVLFLGKRSSGDLRAFLINLAVSDVAMAVFSIPFTYTTFILGQWIFLPGFCTVAMVMQHVSVVVSVYTLSAIGVDRYYAILHPFEPRLTKRRTCFVIAGVWILAVGTSCVEGTVARAKTFYHSGQPLWECVEDWSSDTHSKLYTVSVFALTYAVPLAALTYTYANVVKRVWLRASPGNADRDRDLAQLRSKRKVIKMLVTIVVLFALCWLPLHVFVLYYYFEPSFGFLRTYSEGRAYAIAFCACHWLANAHSFVNPFVYCFMSDNFRADLKDLLKLNSRRQRDSLHNGSTRATASSSLRGSGGAVTSWRWTTTNSDRRNDVKMAPLCPEGFQ